MSSEVLLLSGPNLNELGVRSPEIYGSMTLDDHVATFSEVLKDAGYSVRHVQSNFEGELIESVHAARGKATAIVINAGALTRLTVFQDRKSKCIFLIPQLENRFDTSARWLQWCRVLLLALRMRRMSLRRTPFLICWRKAEKGGCVVAPRLSNATFTERQRRHACNIEQ